MQHDHLSLLIVRIVKENLRFPNDDCYSLCHCHVSLSLSLSLCFIDCMLSKLIKISLFLGTLECRQLSESEKLLVPENLLGNQPTTT